MLEKIWFKTVVAVVTAALLLVFLISALMNVVEDARTKERNKLIQNELITSGLIAERVQLENQLALLEKSDKRIGTVTFLFNEPKEVIYEQIFAAMTLWKINGTIALSDTSLPGDAGNMSPEEYTAMLDAGWAGAILFDGEGSLSEYLTSLRTALSARGLDLPHILYFKGIVDDAGYVGVEYNADGSYKIGYELDKIMTDYGIEFVVQETYQSGTVCYEQFDKPFRYCEAVGFNATQGRGQNTKYLAALSLMACADKGGSVVYSIGFDEENIAGEFYGTTLTDDTTDDFNRMLSKIAGDYRTALHIMNLAEVKNQRNKPTDTTVEAQKLALQAQLDEVLAKIQAVKDKYSK